MAIVSTTVVVNEVVGVLRRAEYVCTDSDNAQHRWGPVFLPLDSDPDDLADTIGARVQAYLENRELEELLG